MLHQPLQQWNLGCEELLAGGMHREPGGAVDLGELLHPAAARRPFDRERVARDRVGVEVALHRPGGHALAVALADLAELERRAVRARGAELLGELAARACQRLLVGLAESLGNAPRARVAAGEERAARMDEQDLEIVAGATEQQDAGTALGHAGRLRRVHGLEQAARELLDRNWREGSYRGRDFAFSVPSPRSYPCQWYWD